MATHLTHSVEQSQRSERELQQVHAELLVSARTLKDRNDIIALLGAMSHRMQATRSNEELAEGISIFVPRVLPGLPGRYLRSAVTAPAWCRCRAGAIR